MSPKPIRRILSPPTRHALALVFLAAHIPGCGGDARVDLAAAQSLQFIANELSLAMDEYHTELDQGDSAREQVIVQSLVKRVRKNPTDDALVEQVTSEFNAALTKLREDRDTERERLTIVNGRIAELREVASGLRRIALESLSLQDEVKRYLTSVIEAYDQANTEGE